MFTSRYKVLNIHKLCMKITLIKVKIT